MVAHDDRGLTWAHHSVRVSEPRSTKAVNRMIDESADKQDETVRLDWIKIFEPPAPIIHSCNCEHCEYVGEEEEPYWPSLIRMMVDGVTYVTDRYIAIREDLAPIPEFYPGAVQDTQIRERVGFMAAALAKDPVKLHEVREGSVQAISQTGWTLRALDGQDRPIGVVATNGEQIGWAMRLPKVEVERPGGDAR